MLDSRILVVYICISRKRGVSEFVSQMGGYSMIAKQDRVSDLLHHFIKSVPNAGRTQLVKFLYLVDVASRSFLGEPITDLEYIWYNHGPFDSRIYNRLSGLNAKGAIKEVRVQYPTRDGYRYESCNEPDDTWLTEQQAAVVEYIVAEFGKKPLAEILKYVYDTAPMKKAKSLGATGQPLDMDAIPNRGALYESIRRGVEQLDRGEGVPFSQIYQRKKTG